MKLTDLDKAVQLRGGLATVNLRLANLHFELKLDMSYTNANEFWGCSAATEAAKTAMRQYLLARRNEILQNLRRLGVQLESEN